MADVSGTTLMMAVQAVHQAVRELEQELERADADPTEATEMLLAYSAAADELRAAYQVARLTTSNLPPYEQLLPTS